MAAVLQTHQNVYYKAFFKNYFIVIYYYYLWYLFYLEFKQNSFGFEIV